MALTTGDVTQKNLPPIIPPDVYPSDPPPDPPPDPPSDPPDTPVVSADPPTPIVDDIQAIQTASGTPSEPLGLARSVAADLSIPFIPPGLSEKQAQALRDSNIRILDEEIGQRAQMKADLDRRDKEFEARMEQHNRAIAFEGSHLQPWNAEREMASRKHDLWEEFGSPGFLVAMMASAFTTMPMVSALNGGAAAMNAINQGDIDGYNTAFEAWQKNTDLVLKRMKIEQDEFNNIDKLRTSNYTRWKEELGLMMDKYGDERKKAMLDAGLDPDVLKAYEGLENLRAKIASNYQAQIENKALFDGIQNELKQNPEGGWFEAYRKTIEKLTIAKNAGKFSGADSAYWARASALTDDPAEQAALVTKWKREAKGTTKAQEDKEQKDKIRKDIAKEHENDPEWTEGKTELEVEKRLATAKKIEARGITSKVQQQIKADLREALGHDLSPTLEAALDAAYTAKGVNSARIISTVGGVINKIKEDLAAGITEDKIKPEERINQAIQAASANAARSAATLYMQKWQQEHPNATAAEAREASLRFQMAQNAVRTLGTREGNIRVSIEEIDKFAPLAEAASKKLKRGKITPFNSWEQVIARSTGTPGQGELDIYTAEILSAYANAMQRGGHTTDASRSAALALLSQAYSHKTYMERIRAMQTSMQKIREAVKAAEDATSKSEDEDQPKTDPAGIR